SNGLSHNRYNEFNVDKQGLILNNATEAGLSQLGGAVAVNANLNGKSASIILNEVVAANRSTLNGYIEVNGQAAEVILANPYGITCDGCGFINTPRATLTTGTPNIDGSGNLTGFSVRSGDIAIQGAGLDASRQNYFDLIARSFTIAGQVNAKDLQLIAGSNDFNYATRAAAIAAATGTAPTISIDSSQLGGMYADRIRLIATENGVGVRLLGDVAASVDDITLSAAGKLQLQGKMSAQRDLNVAYTGAAATDAMTMTGA
ncbi:MAG: filamentous hemagglutinin N-terminal domain-containing protein, partial [Steroidobacter sp.]